MQTISGDVWKNPDVVVAMKMASTRAFCIAYVTQIPRGMFRRGDVLICDASKKAVSCGETDPRVLMKLVSRGVEVYSCEALHAKCAVMDDYVLLGSANLSVSSAERLRELSVLQKSPSFASQVREFINELLQTGQAKRVDNEQLRKLKHLWRKERSPWQNGFRTVKTLLEGPEGSHVGQFNCVCSVFMSHRSPKGLDQDVVEENRWAAAESASERHDSRQPMLLEDFRTTQKDLPKRLKRWDRLIVILHESDSKDARARVYGPGMVTRVVKEGRYYLVYYAVPEKGMPYGKFEREVSKFMSIGRLKCRSARQYSDEVFEQMSDVIREFGRRSV